MLNMEKNHVTRENTKRNSKIYEVMSIYVHWGDDNTKVYNTSQKISIKRNFNRMRRYINVFL